MTTPNSLHDKWTEASRIAYVMDHVPCSVDEAIAYLIGAEGHEDDAITDYMTDRLKVGAMR